MMRQVFLLDNCTAGHNCRIKSVVPVEVDVRVRAIGEPQSDKCFYWITVLLATNCCKKKCNPTLEVDVRVCAIG